MVFLRKAAELGADIRLKTNIREFRCRVGAHSAGDHGKSEFLPTDLVITARGEAPRWHTAVHPRPSGGRIRRSVGQPRGALPLHERQHGASEQGQPPATIRPLISVVAGFRPASSSGIHLALAFIPLVGLISTALSTVIGTTLNDMQGIR